MLRLLSRFAAIGLVIASTSAAAEKTFIDYFQPMPIRSSLRSDVWGAPGVFPRDVQNGLEDVTMKRWCYWDGQIIKGPDGRYHMFASRWDQAKGHNGWFGSVAVHAVADNVMGPYVDQGLCFPNNQGGKGHNVTALVMADGRYALVISETRPGEVFVSKSLDGPWEHLGSLKFEGNGFATPRMSNVSIMLRPDGNYMIVPRSGQILISRNGILGPYRTQGHPIYPDIPGLPLRNLEDPVVWFSGGLYHIVVNGWSDRKAYHLTSRDGITGWTCRGLAYDPTKDFLRYTDGTVNHWDKIERPAVVIENGHVTHLTFAVLDVPKNEEKGNDSHGSKVIVVPFDGAALDRDLKPVADAPIPGTATTAPRTIAAGKFQPNWDSLVANYQCPEWFRDAKFGIWAHWSAQCVPERGDWYAREMYLEGSPKNVFHVKTYGHPSKFGFMELDNLWKAERWDPEKLMTLYKRAGAKYFVALANHHDNFDAYDSKYHAWNSVNVGPKKDIVGTWAKIARANGLRFGVSNHSAHAWHWFQVAYGYDAEGPQAGVRYDAFTLRKEDGKGKWWEGLDPQELYVGPSMPMPDGLKTLKETKDWHELHDRRWTEQPPANNPAFTDNWFLRCQDLMDKYQPDLVYFDDTELPLGQAGLDIAAHYYNANAKAHGGRLEAVLNAKMIPEDKRAGLVADIERGVAEGIRPLPWQTDTCIGGWHYDRSLYEKSGYKSVGQVVRMLTDIVSKNGNLLLSIPVRGDGTIDELEVSFLEGMAKWMDVNSEAIFGTRPWTVYGEGPSTVEDGERGHFGGNRDVRSKPYTSADIRFTAKGDAVYALLLAWPEDRTALVKSFGVGSPPLAGHSIAAVTLLGSKDPLRWSQDAAGLHVTLPDQAPCEHAFALKIQVR